MTPAEVDQALAELDLVRRRRELLFWTMSWCLTMIVLLAMTLEFVGSELIAALDGTPVDTVRLAVGAGVGGAGAGAQLLLLLRTSGPNGKRSKVTT